MRKQKNFNCNCNLYTECYWKEQYIQLSKFCEELENAEGRAFYADTATMTDMLGKTRQENEELKEALKNLLEVDPIKSVQLKDDDFWLECLYCAEEIHASLSFYDEKLHYSDCPYIYAKKTFEKLETYTDEINILKYRCVVCGNTEETFKISGNILCKKCFENQYQKAIELLKHIYKAPFTVDKATVPSKGIDYAPEQVILEYGISLIIYRRIKSLLAEVVGQDYVDEN